MASVGVASDGIAEWDTDTYTYNDIDFETLSELDP